MSPRVSFENVLCPHESPSSIITAQMPSDQLSPYDQIQVAVFRGLTDEVESLCHRYPELATEGDNAEEDPTIVIAAGEANARILKLLLAAGFNVNAKRLPEKTTALVSAIRANQDENIQIILKHNPDLTIGRPLISALSTSKEPNRRLKYVKWLVEAGADVNQLHDLYGDSNKQFTALDWTNDPAVIEYLRSKGAKTAAELR